MHNSEQITLQIMIITVSDSYQNTFCLATVKKLDHEHDI